MGKKLFVSPTGGSGLRVLNVLECPAKCKYYADGWSVRKTPFYFPYGTCLHKHAQKPYPKTDKDGNAVAPEQIDPDAASAEIQKICDTGKVFDEYRDREDDVEVKSKDMDMPRVMHSQLEAWEQVRYPCGRVKQCEYKVKADPMNPDTGNVDQEAADLDFCLVGRLDLLIDNENGEPAIRDIKSTASPMKESWQDNLQYLQQMSTYRYELTAMGEPEVNDLAAFQLVKNKTLKGVLTHAHELPMKPLRYDWIYKLYFGAVKLFREHERKNDWEEQRRYTQCQGMYSACPFVPFCYYDQFDDGEAAVESSLVQRKTVWE